MADPDWRGGRYLEEGLRPSKGLAVARMGAHITYLSEMALHRKFGRNFQDRIAPTFSFDADFQIESYLRHQGLSFVERFDANSYLYVTRAMDYFDLAADYGGVARQRLPGHLDPLLPHLVHLRLAFPDRRTRAPSCTRSTPPAHRSASSRSRATRATTRFSSTSRRCSRRRGASSTRRRGRGGSHERGRASLDAVRRGAGRVEPAPRLDFLLVAGMVEPGARVLDVGCGDGTLLTLLRDRRGSTDAASSFPARASATASPRASRSSRATPTRTLPTTRTTPSITSSCRRRSRRRASPASCSNTSCASAAAPSSRFRISAIGGCAAIWRCAAGCR